MPAPALVNTDPNAEMARKLAAAAAKQPPLDARPVGGVRLSEYELSNGQRVLVVDEMQAPPARPVIYY